MSLVYFPNWCKMYSTQPRTLSKPRELSEKKKKAFTDCAVCLPVQGCAAFLHLRVREIVTSDGPIKAAWPSSSHFPLLFFFFVYFWLSDRVFPSCRRRPSLFPFSFSLLLHPIWACMGDICWRLWVTRVSNELPLFWRHDFAFPVGVKIFLSYGCLVSSGFGDLF